MWLEYFYAIIPIFVAVDIIGMIPLYLSLTEGIPVAARNRILQQSVMTATLVSFIFLGIGNAVFAFLGITASDFKIAGGIILFAISINDLLFSTENRKSHEVKDETTEIAIHQQTTIGIVPIGIPLIVGPALLTSILICNDTYGTFPTIASVIINLLVVYFSLRYSSLILRLTGRSGAKGIAKVFTLLLAAIGVMMVRNGIIEIIRMTP
jgi:multiple antibiotic resistance protein